MTNKQAINILLNEKKCIDRNDGVKCNRECGSCDLVMDVETIREAYNMAISALEAQEVKHSTELSSTHKALDTISRQEAIDEFYCTDELIVSGSANAQNVTNYINKVIGKINALPPAQPEIIRCCDCKHYNAGFECLIEGYGIERSADWYCGDAERREDG